MTPYRRRALRPLKHHAAFCAAGMAGPAIAFIVFAQPVLAEEVEEPVVEVLEAEAVGTEATNGYTELVSTSGIDDLEEALEEMNRTSSSTVSSSLKEVDLVTVDVVNIFADLKFPFIIVDSSPEVVPAAYNPTNIDLIYAVDGEPYENLEVEIYQIDKVTYIYNMSDDVTLKPEYQAYKDQIDASRNDPEELARVLEEIVEKDKIVPTHKIVTSAEGIASFLRMEPGTYFIKPIVINEGWLTTTFQPVVLNSPSYNEQGRPVAVTSYTVPSEQAELPDVPCTITVSWDDAGNEDMRPEAVEVPIFLDGILLSSPTVSEFDSWQFDWTVKEGSGELTLEGIDIPSGYTLEVVRDGNDFELKFVYIPDEVVEELPVEIISAGSEELEPAAESEEEAKVEEKEEETKEEVKKEEVKQAKSSAKVNTGAENGGWFLSALISGAGLLFLRKKR